MTTIWKCWRFAVTVLVAALGGEAVAVLAFGDRSVAGWTSGVLSPARAQQGESNGLFRGIGVVTAVDSATGSLTVNHEEIAGLMSAMEMLFHVDPRSVSEGVRPGDKIDFLVDGKTYTIKKLEVIGHTK